MRKLFLVLIGIVVIGGCQEEQPDQAVYALYQAGFKPTSGTATFTDLEGGKIKVEIYVKNFTEGEFPAHLHFGGIDEIGELAYRLKSVDGVTGRSITVLDNIELPDGEILTYDLLMQMDASIKIHQNSEVFSKVVVAYGNVGANDNYISSGIAQCTGH